MMAKGVFLLPLLILAQLVMARALGKTSQQWKYSLWAKVSDKSLG
jgi:hypothetical protein